ncbi:MAG TPA: DUF87 domain-containing protein [Candidatus Nanoarchaeia archaeon]|nr:DUF87 domain-containing protein [Candidatus Nanoarchaeia archaeon]
MSYEIPPPLQHKEKIIFSLTFEQLIYSGVSLGFSTIIFKLISNNNLKFTLIIFITIIAILFMFFSAKVWIKNFIHFFKFRRTDDFSSSMKSFIGINEVTDSYIINNKNQRIVLLEVQPINFNIKSDEEKEVIIQSFQKFLNSIDFPVQILIASENISLEDHFNVLKNKLRNDFNKLFNDYKNFINNSISVNEIKNRKFYIVVKEKNSLDIEVNIVESKLRSIGLKVSKVESTEKNKVLLNKLYNYFNQYKDFKPLNNKEGEIKNGCIVSPKLIINNKNHLEVNNCLNRVVAAVGYPNSVEKGFLDKIISSNDNFDISIHLEPFPIEFMLIQLNNELKKQRADMFSESLKGIINPSLEIKYSGTRKVLEELQKGKQKLFNVSLYINCKTKKTENYKLTQQDINKIKEVNPQGEKEKPEKYNKRINKLLEYKEKIKPYEDLDLLSQKVSSELNSLMIQPKVPIFRQSDAYKSIIPVGEDYLKLKRNITTEALSAFFPFTSPFLSCEPEGIMLGLNKNKIPFIKDLYKLTNANGLILATSGGGKSYFTKLLLTRLFMQGTKILIIDPQGEYAAITKECKGQIITISKDSTTIINPLDLMGHSYEEKRLQLIDLFKIMLGELSEVQRGVLDKAVDETYNGDGIRKKGNYDGIQTPTISSLYNTLIDMMSKADNTEKSTYTALINRLYIYTKDGVFGFLDKQTNIDFSNDFVCFNIGFMPKQVKPIIMFLVLDYIYTRMKKDLTRKLLVLDEAWSLLARSEEEGYIFEIVKTCRKFNLGLLMITQDVADLVNSKAGHAALANSSYTFLLRQKPAVIDSIARVFNLSPSEKNILLTCSIGSGLLILDNEHQELEIKASEEEHKLITTNPDEILESERRKERKPLDKKKIDAKLDTAIPYYERNKITIEQAQYLTDRGYKPGKFHKFTTKGNPNEYLVKEELPESIMHSFVTSIIYQYILTKTKNVERHLTVKPDIIFTDNKGKRYAIEIETGEGYKKHKDRIKDKFTSVKNEYGNNCVIVLTEIKKSKLYKKFGIQIIGREQIIEYINKIFG